MLSRSVATCSDTGTEANKGCKGLQFGKTEVEVDKTFHQWSCLAQRVGLTSQNKSTDEMINAGKTKIMWLSSR